MSQPLDELYLTWLYSQVGSVKVRDRRRTYWHLLRQLYTKKFEWYVPNDDNRIEDGKALRLEFMEECETADPDPEWMGLECSMLEMMLALSHHLSFITDGEVGVWFWHLIETLDLRQYSDRHYDKEAELTIDNALETVIHRTYGPDGSGGLFPLQRPQVDQREVEIWYQLNAYLLEQF